jgi:hypothetical protein
VSEAFDQGAFFNVQVHNVGYIFGPDVLVKNLIRLDHDDGTLGAGAETSGFDYPNGKFFFLKFFFEELFDLEGTGGDAAAAGTEEDLALIGAFFPFLQNCLPELREVVG